MKTWIVELADESDGFGIVWADNEEEAEREAYKDYGDNWLYVHEEEL